jgi:hypothetical protein
VKLRIQTSSLLRILAACSATACMHPRDHSSLANAPDSRCSTPLSSVEQWKSAVDGAAFPSQSWEFFRDEDGRSAIALTPLARDSLPSDSIVSAVDFGRHTTIKFRWRFQPLADFGIGYGRLSAPFVVDGRPGQELSYPLGDDVGNAATPSDQWRTGALFGHFAPTVVPLRPEGAWNESMIVVDYPFVEHWLNGQEILRFEMGEDGQIHRWIEGHREASTPGAWQPGEGVRLFFYHHRNPGRVELSDLTVCLTGP